MSDSARCPTFACSLTPATPTVALTIVHSDDDGSWTPRTATNTFFSSSSCPSATSVSLPPIMSSSSSRTRTPVPLLLDAFPLPPSHIPATPQSGTFSNPPPSKPPSSPLPPVPGPSRISEADTLQLLLQSSRGHSSKSRRSSKYSEANRDSVISTTSSNGGSGSGSVMSRLGSTRPSERPLSPSARGRSSLSSPIEEERLAPPMLMRDVVSPMLPIFDDDDEEEAVAAGGVTTSPRRRRKRHQANESISSIDVRDIMGAVSGGEEEVEEAVVPKPLASEKTPARRPMADAASTPIAPSHSHKSSLAYLKFDTDDDDQDKSNSHSIPSANSSHSLAYSSMEPSFDDFASTSTTTLRSQSPSNIRSSSTAPILYPTGNKEKQTRNIPKDGPRAPSPDIDTIIQSTPKLNKRSFSMGSSANRSRATSLRSVKSMKNVREEEVDEFGALPGAIRLSKTTMGKKPLLPDDLDYVVQGSWTNQEEDNEEKLKALERELDGGDSDSDLDLHTPLPHLMVRDGLLSSNSKLFADSRANTPLIGGGRPGSSMSTVTKSGVIKDERDTPMRRVRHRDGRLLRGGIGLTTGLGWSDSEDEDAPSPLTRRLSTLNLSRRSSASSFFSTSSRSPHPLSRSYSSGTLYEDSGFSLGGPPMESDEDLLKDMAGWSDRRPPASNPPTAWPKRGMPSPSARSSVASSNGRQSFSSSAGRLSVGSNGSNFSMEVTSPTEATLLRTPSRPRGSVSSGESIQNRRSGDSSVYSRSTASTVSIPLPVTPQNEARVPNHVTSSTPHVNKNKSLPPLPGVLKKTPSKASLRGSQLAFPRARTTSSSSTKAPVPSTPLTPVRPLRLPGQVRAASRGDRAAVPVPSLSSSALRSSHSQGDIVTSPTSPTSPTPSKPRPRIGNGMVYKRSVSASTKVRPPMPLHSNSMSTSSIGRPSGLPRAL
ncbi:60s acidic ribosomal protein [Coprinopsis sp. MPI-PUGE-AT-0042]|nr:60s acidic ribosomal protein [Coprinopsis sp. MPI-PUGE-AT-0042]